MYSWGFFAHKKINRHAVFTLPPEMFGFYKAHIEYLTENAVAPDKRRYATKDEAPRHYIDIDHYSKEDPFGVMPMLWRDAVAKYSEDTLQAWGIVPWHIIKMYYKLTEAFKEKDIEKILYLSADYGHYIADAHVPLHTTENYNGQLTNQKGIHGFWESRLPELYYDNYDLFTGKAKKIENVLTYTWEIVKESHYKLDSVLSFEKKLHNSFGQDMIYAYETRGATTMKVYSKEYSSAYHDALEGMIERRMKETIIAVGSYWYSAWVNAGSPDLNNLIGKESLQLIRKEEKELEKMWRTGKIYGREHSH